MLLWYICKKYYLDVVIKELNLNNTYKEVHNNSVNIISIHLDYMVKNDIDVQVYKNSMNSYHHSTGYLSCTKNLTVPGSLLLQIHAPPNSSRHYLLLVLKQYLSIINNIVMVFITILELIIFGLLTTLLKYWTGYIKLIRPQELENLIVTILLHYIRISHTMP